MLAGGADMTYKCCSLLLVKVCVHKDPLLGNGHYIEDRKL